ncbi:hypothetical protein GFB56_12280 [Ensifer sp. T173]|uniref:Ribbon-helix-helix protein CopG domain-containing protein n=1 Tax=Ensifer canadensis TaxID=555315 RepID=A0AAW4FHH7_9HYPH|nr:hypothetical protein [Ensifer canadensis]MBM3091593.1 hypothetical protein [Ensifer canadensis]UBI74422.1 hypothetical protein J3R84_13075 [Ensifer canadensis]
MVKARENRVPIMMSDDELKLIDDWRFTNRIATRSDAIRRLCQLGLALGEIGDFVAPLMAMQQRRLDAADIALDKSHRALPKAEQIVVLEERLRAIALYALEDTGYLVDNIVGPVEELEYAKDVRSHEKAAETVEHLRETMKASKQDFASIQKPLRELDEALFKTPPSRSIWKIFSKKDAD